MSEQPESIRVVLSDGFAHVGRLLRAHKWAFALAASGAIAFATAIVAAAVVIGRVSEELIIPVLDGGEPLGRRWVGAVVAIGAVALFKGFGIILRRTAAGWLQFRSQADMRYRLISHQLGLKLSWFNRQSTGDLLAVTETDARQATFILAPLPFATGATVLLVITTVIVTAIDVWMGLLAIGALVLTIVIDVFGTRRVFADFEKVQQTRGKVSGLAHESFDGALTVKSLGREDFETERMRKASDGLRDDIIVVTKIWAFYRSIVESLPTATIIVLLVLGVARINGGDLTPGDLVTITYLVSLLTWPIRMIAFVLWDMSESLAGWRRVERILEVDEFVEHGRLIATPADTGAVVAGDEVAFGYLPDERILSEVRWDIPAGRTIAVVGATGSGKSTLAMLLARLWDPDTGEIKIDGRDLRAFARSELPREVAFVAQESFLFDDDVTGNIALGGKSGSEAVEAAARLAVADEFIGELPQGFGTQLGERGTTLSGGQRQRIALARALVRRPRLLILDDATSSVDSSVETEILRGLRRADLPATVVIVAHRRSSIMLADEVVFLAGGRITAHGTHAELLASEPGYARLLEAYEEDLARRDEEREQAEAVT
ncbi:MAG: ABC transporter ATP-binding protein/permease [Acidimicrobiia bacterium]|nr:ABC transporter ATP-binding protein/permease [Acidimicrobiia bacterium]